MTLRSKIARTCLLGALLSPTAMVSTGALAQSCCQAGGSATGANAWSDGNATSAQWPADTAAILGMTTGIAPPPSNGSDWWFHGTVEVGGRDFVNNPEKNGETALKFGPSFVPPKVTGTQSLSGYYEYSDIKPGAFGNFDISAGTKDGLYQIDIGGSNVGYADQHYYFDWSKAGEQYFNFIWDQSPHLYSMNAITPFERNGNTVTFLPNVTGTCCTAAVLQQFGVLTNIGIDRDTAAGSYRWTPNDWDFNLDYSHMQRTGTQPTQGFAGNAPTTGLGFAGAQFMKPVDDSTQNYDANAEHVGTSPWGMRYVFSLGYSGSVYQDSYNSYLVQHAAGSTAFATFANWPSNQANGFSSTLSADLPWNSRYAGTVQYTLMQQNAAFVDGNGFLPSGQSSLDGAIYTLLSNNTLTTKLTDTVTAKTTFRYYDFKNDTAELGYHFNGETLDTTAFAATPLTANSISMGYIKTNVGETLEWRPDKYWNLGAAYQFERYDWTRADVNVTNENGGKLFADYKPFTWLTSRSSVEYSDRRYENYNYCAYVGSFQWDSSSCTTSPADTSALYSLTERQLMIDNRQLWKANYLVDVVVARGLTVTPWTKFQDASYGVDPFTEQGLQHTRDWNFGVDGLWVVTPDLSFMASYSRMYGNENMYGSTNGGPYLPTVVSCTATTGGPYAPQCQDVTFERNVVNTFMAAVNWAVIPDRLNTELRYTASHGTDDLNFDESPGLAFPFPENKVWFQRLDATLVYKFDRQQVTALGWKGDLKAKLNYSWELNSETNWANDPLALSTASSALASGLWMGWYNPNYSAQIVSASLIAGW